MYVTLAQLAEIPGAKELSELASTAHEALVDYELMDLTLRGLDRSAYPADAVVAADEAAARITSAVDDAGAFIDGFLVVRGYTTPLTPVPGIVATWARAIARYYLAKDRITDPKSDPIARDYADAAKLLQLVANGQFSLGTGDPLAGEGLGTVEIDGDDRVFSRTNLKDAW